MSRLGTSYNLPTPSSNGTSSTGVADPPRQYKRSSSGVDSSHTTMPVSSAKPPTKKRQRSREQREPDWGHFYKNGLPKEVIVIDDSPEPTVNSNLNTNGTAYAANSRHAAKKRKRDGTSATYDPVFHADSRSSNQTPLKVSVSGSTVSTDRTTSVIHTTAATSLGSHSSNGQNGYESAEAQPGQKRKRTNTRLQLANEQKRRELEANGDAFTNYKPPPRPPIKAPDVQVKQIADVSISHLDHLKVDANKTLAFS